MKDDRCSIRLTIYFSKFPIVGNLERGKEEDRYWNMFEVCDQWDPFRTTMFILLPIMLNRYITNGKFLTCTSCL